ncbi:MAG TPA: cytochrome c oxidase subunit II [Chloroflexota bacterium]
MRRWSLRTGIVATCVLVMFGLAPIVALAKTNRPNWDPGPPWAPLSPGSSEMLEISNLFWVMLVLSGIVFALVCGILITSAVRYSARRGDTGEPRQVFGNRTVEIAWTVIPTLILLVAFIATTKAIHDINTPESGQILNVNVIGHQWWWEFQYPSLGVVTANELHLPSGRPIHFHITSADVIHSFWTAQLQRQVDANPRQDNAVFLKVAKPGVYSGACYEYCGESHAWMKYRVVVQTPAAFAAWAHHEIAGAANPSKARGSTAASKSTLVYGSKVFLSNTCVNCHAVTGTPAGGAVGPNLTHIGSRWTIGAGALPMSEPNLESWIYNPSSYKPGVLMPPYPFLSAKDLHALAAYLYSLK